MKKALFLDRDGVINVDRGYVSKIKDFEFYEEIFPLCKHYIDLGYLVIVITNQTGIGLGKYSLKDFYEVNNYMLEAFLEKDAPIDDVFFCPHNPNSNCSCRKPKPKMFFDAKEKYNIDLENSIMIGDKITDALGAYNAGVGTIYLINNDVELDIKVHRIRSLLEAIK